jgi:hypothetical protein
MVGFEYPAQPHQRRHGPAGYKNYGSYRDWLRDEFMFRCVYCLHREQWYSRSGTFHIDHFIPVNVDADGVLQYANLRYACATCNEAKAGILGLPDPCSISFRDCIEIVADGHAIPRNAAGQRLCDVLRLNSSANVEFRSRWIGVLEALRRHGETKLYQEFMGFPAALPDLRSKKAPKNEKPESVTSCYFALRERGELPATYD